jgi:hypothetical protein
VFRVAGQVGNPAMHDSDAVFDQIMNRRAFLSGGSPRGLCVKDSIQTLFNQIFKFFASQGGLGFGSAE